MKTYAIRCYANGYLIGSKLTQDDGLPYSAQSARAEAARENARQRRDIEAEGRKYVEGESGFYFAAHSFDH